MKNLSIRTEEAYKDEVENLLLTKDIPYKIEIEKSRETLYSQKVLEWGLPPYTDSHRGTRYVYLIPLEYKNTIIDLFQFPKTNLNYFHYKLPKKIKPQIQFHSTSLPNIKYPIYVVSYQRYDDNRNKTIKNLEQMAIPYYVVIQEREEKQYREYLEHKNYCRDIILSEDTFEGSWKQRETAMSHGRDSHLWILDDNIDGWKYVCHSTKVKIQNACAFTLLEEMSHRVDRVGIVSHNYCFDTPSTSLRNPVLINNKNYSSMLINVKLLREHHIHWRLKYNEDVDLTLQCFSKGIYTLSTSIFLADKCPTGSVKGGNSDIYQGAFQKKFDCLKETWKDSPINDLILLTYDRHKSKRPHHKINFKKCAETYGLDQPTWIEKNQIAKTYEMFGMELRD